MTQPNPEIIAMARAMYATGARLLSWERASEHTRDLYLCEAEAAYSTIQPQLERLQQALRIRIWNDCKAKGMRDDDAYKRIDSEIDALLTPLEQREDCQ